MGRGQRLVVGPGSLCTDRIRTRFFAGTRSPRPSPSPSPDSAWGKQAFPVPLSPVPGASLPCAPGPCFPGFLTSCFSRADALQSSPRTRHTQPSLPGLLEAHTGRNGAHPAPQRLSSEVTGGTCCPEAWQEGKEEEGKGKRGENCTLGNVPQTTTKSRNSA